LEGAIDAYRTSNIFSPNGPKGQYFLGLTLLEQGRYAEAMVHLRRAHDLGSPAPDWLCPAAVANCETLVKLDTRLPALLSGEQEPTNVQEQISLAGVCLGKRQFERAARYFDEAFTQEPGLTQDVICCQWYDAGCAAAMASIGEGDDASSLSDEQRIHRRQQALDWLRIDLQRRSAFDRHSNPKRIGKTANLRLETWLHESALKGVRDEEYLAKLPAEQREACVKLWNDVRELLDRAKIPRWKSFSPRS
jgi:tetratricopeptide (TPR) repeat protein